MPELVYLLLGGNLGHREQNLQLAREQIRQQIAPILNTSSVYETEAWGVANQQPYLNQVLSLAYEGTPADLLRCTQQIEANLGRTRHIRWEARLIDIDILFFGQEVVQEAGLEIPHPRLHLRRFTLVPLAEIEPEFRHPVLQKTIAQLLAECPDQLPVVLFEAGR